MFYGKMWLVVPPKVGLPLFFGGVALTSLAVHTAVLTHTTWFPAFLQGNQHVKGAVAAAAPAAAMAAAEPASAPTINVASAPAGPAPSVVINVAPGLGASAAPK